MFKRISIFWIVVVALLVTSAIPLGAMAVSAIQNTERGVEREQKNQLIERVGAHAATINQQLRQFELTTELAAAEARKLLLDQGDDKLTDAQIQERLKKYSRGTAKELEGVYGLDDWYKNVYFKQVNDDKVSNVYLNKNTPLTPQIGHDIAVTEDLDPLFRAIHESGSGTQWIYMTTPDGMMRLYPWAGNEGYGTDWQPQDKIFYTVADQKNNPQRKSVWTLPYNDYADAGLMVTSSVPIYNGDKLLAVMSHDMVINVLQKQVLGFQVGQKGFAFLIDREGHVIAHRDYKPENIDKGATVNIKLDVADEAMAPVVNAMLTKPRDVAAYKDKAGEEWVVVFDRIPTTDWHLGMLQPRREIIQPALDIANQVIVVGIGLVLVALLVSVLLARGIARPLARLSNVAQKVEASVDEETRSMFSPENIPDIGGTKEIAQLGSVFSQMVAALQQRMNELNSVYAMGQAITANVDYEQTLQSVLSAIRPVMDYDAAEIIIARDDQLVVEAWWGKEGFRDTTGEKHKIGVGLIGLIGQYKGSVLVPTFKNAEDIRGELSKAGAGSALEAPSGSLTGTGMIAQAALRVELDSKKLSDAGVRSYLGIPLVLGNQLVGALILMSRDAGQFTESNKRQLSKLAPQASIAISNAIQVRQREQALKAQIRELQIVIDESKREAQVGEIVETDFFRELQERAQAMRVRKSESRTEHKRESGETQKLSTSAPDPGKEPTQ